MTITSTRLLGAAALLTLSLSLPHNGAHAQTVDYRALYTTWFRQVYIYDTNRNWCAGNTLPLSQRIAQLTLLYQRARTLPRPVDRPAGTFAGYTEAGWAAACAAAVLPAPAPLLLRRDPRAVLLYRHARQVVAYDLAAGLALRTLTAIEYPIVSSSSGAFWTPRHIRELRTAQTASAAAIRAMRTAGREQGALEHEYHICCLDD